ncbi:MAG: putative lipid II flippase FtsW [Proteobacteria bacterium]|nr:putative lipid II flippase FtsW [Pseudomonadota bacterium]
MDRVNQLFDRRYLNFFKKWWLDVDKINFFLIISIMFFGLMMIASASPAIAKRIEVDKFFFLKKQLIFAFVALLMLVAISLLDHDKIKILALVGLGVSVLLLLLVLIRGVEIKGAKRWVSLFGFALQPSEFAKTFFIVVNAFLLQRFSAENWRIKYGISATLLLSIACLLLLQPDFGMTLTFTVLWAAQLFVYGLPVMLIITLGCFAVVGGIGAYLTFPHVEDRINRFLDSGEKNYQVERSIDAFVNGSFFGTGPGNGVVKKYIPDAHTDFIFAVIGEEFGVLSCIFLLLVFVYFITRIVKYALDEDDMFSYLALCGLMMQFAMQVMVNVGVSMSLLPTKGMTLPFISYGGSSMVSMSICFGLILAFTKKKYHRDVDYGNIKLI